MGNKYLFIYWGYDEMLNFNWIKWVKIIVFVYYVRFSLYEMLYVIMVLEKERNRVCK